MLMNKPFAILLMMAFLSCHEIDQKTVPPDPALEPEEEAEGVITDYAAVDGCGLSLEIPKDSATTIRYAISDRSKDLVQRYVTYTNATAELKATVRFQRTNQKKDVLCGWVGNKPFDEVLLLSIKPR